MSNQRSEVKLLSLFIRIEDGTTIYNTIYNGIIYNRTKFIIFRLPAITSIHIKTNKFTFTRMDNIENVV